MKSLFFLIVLMLMLMLMYPSVSMGRDNEILFYESVDYSDAVSLVSNDILLYELSRDEGAVKTNALAKLMIERDFYYLSKIRPASANNNLRRIDCKVEKKVQEMVEKKLIFNSESEEDGYTYSQFIGGVNLQCK